MSSLHTNDELALKTYRYLRIAMVGMVLTLLVSIVIERLAVSCWQTSVSGYYYTPVRAVFVGGLMVIGVSLIAIKGSTRWEDTFFNFAGIMAPAVAVLPTSDIGTCWSIDPPADSRTGDGQLADWILANIDNNTKALLIAGFLGLTIGAILAAISNRDPLAPARVGGTDLRLGLLATLILLIAVLALHLWWDAFSTRAHGFAAVFMFVFLGAGITSNALQRRDKPDRRTYMSIYISVVIGMAVTGVVLLFFFQDWGHRILFLETIEISLFVVFWLTQTHEHWNEPTLASVQESAPPGDAAERIAADLSS